jgi:hypothetical protein
LAVGGGGGGGGGGAGEEHQIRKKWRERRKWVDGFYYKTGSE